MIIPRLTHPLIFYFVLIWAITNDDSEVCSQETLDLVSPLAQDAVGPPAFPEPPGEADAKPPAILPPGASTPESENKSEHVESANTTNPWERGLKKLFHKSKEIAKLSEHFVMVNTQDEEEPEDEAYKIDGNYIPRIFFMNPEGDVLHDVQNPKPDYADYKYYYGNPAPIIKSMKAVMKRFSISEKDEL